MGQDAAAQVGAEGVLDPARHALAAGIGVGGVSQEGLEVVLDEGLELEGGSGGLAPAVDGGAGVGDGLRVVVGTGSVPTSEDASGWRRACPRGWMGSPIVAVVHGRAIAGGAGLATACDLILAAESAAFGYPEVHLGFVPAMVTALLRRAIGEKRIFEMIATGARFSAAEARDIGLVARVFPDDRFDDMAATFLTGLASRSPSALQLCKRLLYGMDGLSFETAIARGAEINAIARATPDCQAGVRRFLERKD